MTLLDWILIVLWAGFALAGFWKGAVKLIFGVGGLLLGIWLAFMVAPELGEKLAAAGLGEAGKVAGWVLPILASVMAAAVAGWGMEKTLKALGLGWANRLVGAFLCVAAAGLVLAVLLATLAGLSPEFAAKCEGSRIASILLALAGSR